MDPLQALIFQADQYGRSQAWITADSLYRQALEEGQSREKWNQWGYVHLRLAGLAITFLGQYEVAYQKHLRPVQERIDAGEVDSLEVMFRHYLIYSLYWKETGRVWQAEQALKQIEGFKADFIATERGQRGGIRYLQMLYGYHEGRQLIAIQREQWRKALQYSDSCTFYLKQIEGDSTYGPLLAPAYQALWYSNRGLIYEVAVQYDSAQHYYRLALASLPPRLKSQEMDLYFNLAALDWLQGNLKAAEANSRKSLALAIEQVGPNAPELGRRHLLLAWVFRAQGKEDSALHHLNRLIALESQHPERYDPGQPLPPAGELQVTGRLFAALLLRAQLLHPVADCATGPSSPGDSTSLLQALAHAELSRDLLDTMRLQGYLGSPREAVGYLDTLSSMMRLGARLSGEAAALDPAQAATYARNAYHFSESSRYNQLFWGLQQEQVNGYAALPPALQQQQDSLSRALAANVTALFAERRKSSPDSAALADLQRTQQQLRQDFDALLKVIEQAHPRYYALKYDVQQSLSAAALQARLAPREVWVEFLVDDDLIHRFVVTDADFRHDMICRTPALDQALATVPALLSQPPDRDFSWEAFRANFGPQSHRLYQALLQEVVSDLPAESGVPYRLYLAGDGPLYGLSWGALLTANPSAEQAQRPETWAFLACDSSLRLSYQYSAAVFATQPRVAPGERRFAREYSGWAGSYQQRATLAYGQETVENLGGFAWPGQAQVYVPEGGQPLAWEQLRQAALQSRILHLSVHGTVDWQDPMNSALHLTDTDSIRAGELYGWQVPAELVVLDACETGRGRQVPAEGMLSLATAFAYAGAPATLTSLWQVDDRANGWLVERFFEYLVAGQAKDQAWQQAQRDYLAESPYDKHPYFWAAMVPVGDMSPLYDEPSGSWPWWAWMLVGLAGLLLLGLAWRQVRRW
jgi:CHAT domain-containing protein